MADRPNEKIRTEYGFMLPNSKVIWGEYKRGQYAHSADEVIRSTAARRKFSDDLRAIAESMDLDPTWFVDQHKIVKRDIITTTTDPVVVTEPVVVSNTQN